MQQQQSFKNRLRFDTPNEKVCLIIRRESDSGFVEYIVCLKLLKTTKKWVRSIDDHIVQLFKKLLEDENVNHRRKATWMTRDNSRWQHLYIGFIPNAIINNEDEETISKEFIQFAKDLSESLVFA